MRISTSQQFERSIDQIQRRQQALLTSQEQLSSGKRIARASDDPGGAALAERARARETRLDAEQRSLQTSQTATAQAESALGTALDVMQRMRELTVQAGNVSTDSAQRQVIADELRGLRQQLLELANQEDSAGGYLFAGLGGAGKPFVDGATGVTFAGAAGQMGATASEALPVYLDGQATWLQGPTGNGVFSTAYNGDVPPAHTTKLWIDSGKVTAPSSVSGQGYELTFTGDPTVGFTVSIKRDDAVTVTKPFVSGQPIDFDGIAVTLTGTPTPGKDKFQISPSTRSLNAFGVADSLIAAFKGPAGSSAQLAQTVSNGLRDLDSSMGALMSARAQLGWRLEQADRAQTQLSDSLVAVQAERAAVEDLDMARAVTVFQSRQTGYDAALKTYSMVQKLSLFDYVR